jgi:pimeloyl-ACP methyl ester carboxylesterase
MMRKEAEVRRALGVTVFLLLAFSIQAAHAGGPPFPRPPADDYDLLVDQVELLPGVTSDIHVRVFVNDERPRFGKTVFAIAGWTHTAATWDQYAEALFIHPYRGVRTSRVVAINLPGHGLSTLPTNMPFGYLLLDDYVTAILGALDGLREHGIYPQEVIGHSQGGLLVQMLQERLVDSDSSLFDEYGILRAVLLGPEPPAGIDWQMIAPGGPGDQILETLLVPEDPVLGPHFVTPAEVWQSLWFSNPDYVVSPDAPTAEQIINRGYLAPAPLFGSMQLAGKEIEGLPYFPRPEVSPGIFGLQSGTLLHVVSYADDTVVLPSEVEEVFDHLICCSWWSRYTLVEAEGGVHDRVHDLHISNPAVIIEAMSEHGWFVW